MSIDTVKTSAANVSYINFVTFIKTKHPIDVMGEIVVNAQSNLELNTGAKYYRFQIASHIYNNRLHQTDILI